MKKVLIVNTVEFSSGGMSSVIMNYYQNINKDEFQIDFVVNASIEPRFRRRIENGDSKIFILERNKLTFIYMIKLFRILKKYNYDIVHVHGNSATMAIDLLPAKIAGSKIRIAHSHNSVCQHYTIHKLLAPIFKKLYTKAIACSAKAGDWIFGEHNFEILKNGIDTELYSYSEEIRNEIRIEFHLQNKFVLGHIGFMNEQKNHLKLIEIMKALLNINKNFVLLCVTGSEVVPEELRSKIQEIESNIIILHNRNDVFRILQAMDVFVLPSLYEGLPVSLIEAQTVGLNCVVSDRVSFESNITGEVRYLPLEKEELWIETLSEMFFQSDNKIDQNIRRERKRKVCDMGYDIKNSIQLLESIYNGKRETD